MRGGHAARRLLSFGRARWDAAFGPAAGRTRQTAEQYWSGHHVDAPEDGFGSIEASLDHLDWRNRQYPGYIELMPVAQADGLVVLDYGCGPGNDTIGFGHYSRPNRIHALDVSSRALELAQARARLHGMAVEFARVQEDPVSIPLADGSVDLVHCSGVLHHTPDPAAILREFKRVLRPGGYGQIMVYHYDSLWMHLYVAFVMMVGAGKFAGLTKRQAFERTLDGPACPIAVCYRAPEFVALAESAGLRCEFIGAGISAHELKFLPRRFEALEEKRLDRESRRFLYELTFDERHVPLHDGVVAGVNACFRIYRNED